MVRIAMFIRTAIALLCGAVWLYMMYFYISIPASGIPVMIKDPNIIGILIWLVFTIVVIFAMMFTTALAVPITAWMIEEDPREFIDKLHIRQPYLFLLKVLSFGNPEHFHKN